MKTNTVQPQVAILVIEDDPGIGHMLRLALSAEHYCVNVATTGSQGLTLAAQSLPAVILLDLGLPDLDGMTVTRKLREWTTTPILILSARGQDADKVAALDAGADDYLTKPFSLPELLARIRAALRHHAAPILSSPRLQVGDLCVDLAGRMVWRGGTEIHLTPTEYELLAELVRHADRVLTHRHLLAAVWGPAAMEQSHYLRVYMAALRHKLEADPSRPRYLTTESGVGYRLRTEFSRGG